MEGKLYTSKNTAIDHLSEDYNYSFSDQGSKTLRMKKQVTAIAVDSVLILFIFIITLFII